MIEFSKTITIYGEDFQQHNKTSKNLNVLIIKPGIKFSKSYNNLLKPKIKFFLLSLFKAITQINVRKNKIRIKSINILKMKIYHITI